MILPDLRKMEVLLAGNISAMTVLAEAIDRLSATVDSASHESWRQAQAEKS